MKSRRQPAAFSLIECLVYIAVLAVVLSLAYSALYRCLAHERNLRRNADDISRTLHAGERWRADIRGAATAPRLADGNLHIPRGATEIVYTLARGTVWRQTGPASATAVLRGVKASRMVGEPRQQVTTWRWELELESGQRLARVRPLFTFEAVAGGQP